MKIIGQVVESMTSGTCLNKLYMDISEKYENKANKK